VSNRELHQATPNWLEVDSTYSDQMVSPLMRVNSIEIGRRFPGTLLFVVPFLLSSDH